MSLKYFLPFALMVVMSACSTISVTYDYDKSIDFSKYKTFAFTTESLEIPVNQLNLNRIVQAVESEMEAKGYTSSDSPELGVDLHLKTEQKVEATATTTGAGYGPYRYRWGMGVSTTQVNYNQYTDGTLFISIIDMKTKKLIWQGIGTKTLDENLSADKREEAINSSIQQIMANFPPQTTK